MNRNRAEPIVIVAILSWCASSRSLVGASAHGYTGTGMTLVYSAGKFISRFIHLCCIKSVLIHQERFEVPGGFVLACSHLSHLEPFIVGTLVDRKIDFMARIEFFRYRLIAGAIYALDGFPVNRQGFSLSAIRTAIARVRAGRVVGIFPEGGVAHGKDSVLRGGAIKKGACVVAYRTAAPILPVAVVGTDKLNRVSPWLPFRRGRVWIIFGHMIHPHLDKPRRIAREMMAVELQAEFQRIYSELLTSCGIDDLTVA
jgi:1-acyl-sn-glycerol-3-phosphate acyltransferase